MNLAQQEWQHLCLAKSTLTRFDAQMMAALERNWQRKHGHFNQWLEVLGDVPSGEEGVIQLDRAAPSLDKVLDESQHAAFRSALETLMPWRKGPFSPCGIDLDCEWRSNLKFERLLDAGVDFSGKHILDVGCGNGYFMLRMLGKGAALTVGIDPSWHYFAQFLALKKLYAAERMSYLPTTLDDVLINDFDLTLSMGVLYHRRDPMQHLWQLKETLRSGGQLILETLVVEGDGQTVFLPPDRYAGMGNVWFLPSPSALCLWLEKLGLRIDYCAEPVPTTAQEQRKTAWMNRHSLDDFMQPDYQATIEGLPPPQRMMVVARKA